MRLCFLIACMAGIGVGLVHLRRDESVARHELLQLEAGYKARRRIAHRQEYQLGYLTTPREVAQRARKQNIDTDRGSVHLAGPTDPVRAYNNRRVTN